VPLLRGERSCIPAIALIINRLCDLFPALHVTHYLIAFANLHEHVLIIALFKQGHLLEALTEDRHHSDSPACREHTADGDYAGPVAAHLTIEDAPGLLQPVVN
jgi:hypothetical protein